MGHTFDRTKTWENQVIEIIPNWHPIFVHFTVALFSTAVGFSILAFLSRYIHAISPFLIAEFKIVARWCLWISALITFVTVSMGFYAYYTVKHDAISHAAMTLHRNWAIVTFVTILAAAGCSLWFYLKDKTLNLLFLILLLIIEGLLLSTAWLGGELVYRYGVGVLSLPQAEEVGHQHQINPTKKLKNNSDTAPKSPVTDHDHR